MTTTQRRSLSELMTSTGITSMSELHEAENELVQAGLLSVYLDERMMVRSYRLLDPHVRDPSHHGGN